VYSTCRKLLKEINASNETRILLDCATDRVLDVLQQAREVKMISVYHSYFITSLVSATSKY
jgi:ionotropic kainate glutamate receptor 2